MAIAAFKPAPIFKPIEMSAEALQHYGAHDSAWMQKRRAEALSVLQNTPMPTRIDEIWRRVELSRFNLNQTLQTILNAGQPAATTNQASEWNVLRNVEAAPGFDRRAGRRPEPEAPPVEVVEAEPAPSKEIARVGSEVHRAEVKLPYKPEDYTLVPLDGMRKTIARRMSQSAQDVPHFSLTIEVELDRFLEARKQLNARLEHEGVKLSVNDILIRACALALKKAPDSNVSFVDGALLKHKHSHIAVAVAVPGGLVTPVVFAAETKGLGDISREMTTLAEKARARKLMPDAYEGGTFTISNLGMYGISSFTSIINEPQAMILSVGAGEQKPIVKNGQLAVGTMMALTLTCDHRAVDGAIGAEFLAALRAFIEDPMMMML